MSNVQAQIQEAFEDVTLEEAEPAAGKQETQTPAEQAETGEAWGTHPINIRITIPLPFGRWFFTFIGGPERRAPERRAKEREKHPLMTFGNVVFLFAIGTILGLGIAVVMINEAIRALAG